ncbi:MAG: hypothetical protein NBV67_16520 [Tagaea sp.]|nr:hypothetical protein [Tagaea sp.]
MMEYVLALRRVGDTARADGELPIVAELMYPNARHRWVPYSPIWRPLRRDAWNEIVLMETSSDMAPLQKRLDHILGRPPIRQKTEEWVIWMLLSRMRTADYPEASFQEHRACMPGDTEAMAATLVFPAPPVATTPKQSACRGA